MSIKGPRGPCTEAHARERGAAALRPWCRPKEPDRQEQHRGERESACPRARAPAPQFRRCPRRQKSESTPQAGTASARAWVDERYARDAETSSAPAVLRTAGHAERRMRTRGSMSEPASSKKEAASRGGTKVDRGRESQEDCLQRLCFRAYVVWDMRDENTSSTSEPALCMDRRYRAAARARLRMRNPRRTRGRPAALVLQGLRRGETTQSF